MNEWIKYTFYHVNHLLNDWQVNRWSNLVNQVTTNLSVCYTTTALTANVFKYLQEYKDKIKIQPGMHFLRHLTFFFLVYNGNCHMWILTLQKCLIAFHWIEFVVLGTYLLTYLGIRWLNLQTSHSSYHLLWPYQYLLPLKTAKFSVE